MKVSELLKNREESWRTLEQMCATLERRGGQKLDGEFVARFATLYRAACADLALAEAYRLPSGTVYYLHHVVARAHNQLYRARKFQIGRWGHELLVTVPQRLSRDRALWLAAVVFTLFFVVSAYLASSASPFTDYARTALGEAFIVQLEEMYADPVGQRASSGTAPGMMSGFYISHNMEIGLRCFAAGLIFGVGGLFVTTFNALYLGAVFGYMTTVPQGVHFFEFVSAHGPFELSAIVISAAAGMRLGFALVVTGGYPRLASLRMAARRAMPTMGAAMVLFFLAALIEEFVSPSQLSLGVKQTVAVVSCALLLFYFVVLGYPQQSHAA